MSEKLSSNQFYNPIIEALVPDPAEIPNVRMLVGMLGRSCRSGYSRLYVTIDLCEYIEYADCDILHKTTIDAQNSALGVNIIWVERSAKFVYTQLETPDHGQSSDGLEGFKKIDLSVRTEGCHYVVDKVHL